MLPPLVIVAFLIATVSGVNASVLVSITQPARCQRLRARDVIAAGSRHLVFSHGRLILLVAVCVVEHFRTALWFRLGE